MSKKRYTIDDMFKDIEKISEGNEKEETRLQNEYIKENAIKPSIVKKVDLDYIDDIYTQPNPPKIKKNKTKTYEVEIKYRSYLIKAIIASLTIVAFNASHLVFVLILPVAFLAPFFFPENDDLIPIFYLVHIALIGIYILLFSMPFISFDIVMHPITNIYSNIRFSGEITEHKLFLLHQSFVISCIIALYTSLRVFFEDTVLKIKPASIMIVKIIILYFIVLIVCSIVLFEVLNLITLHETMQLAPMVAILVTTSAVGLFFLNNYLVLFIEDKLGL